ncbi:hypothetical protein EPN42_04065 [bacterium]|nr:MAG: hypothetical protein EPN42_04065 [bacterium]
MFERALPALVLGLAAVWPIAGGAAEQATPIDHVPAITVTVLPEAGAPVVLDEVKAERDGDGNVDVSASYHNIERKAVTAVRVRFDVFDPFGGEIGYFNGVSQDPLAPLKTAATEWNGDQPYPISAALRARVTAVAFADGTFWQASDVPNAVIDAEHHRLLGIYKDNGLQALLKALGQ